MMTTVRKDGLVFSRRKGQPMRILCALLLGGLVVASQGCSPLWHATRTTIVEPVHYPQRIDDLKELARNKKLAEKAWAEFEETHEEDFSEHYALGFKAGYADYLYAGGSGEPPPLPPRTYWRVEFETPEGQEAIHEWFTGFSSGAAVAAQSGYRELVTVPTSVAPVISAEEEDPPAEEVLPPPKKQPPPEKQEDGE
jgi:hypothetical protein